MYPRLGYARVWAKLTAGLAGLDVPCPSEKALRDLRRRLGPAPLKALFEVVAGPLAQPGTPGVRFGGLRTVAFDGCNSLKVPDTRRNRWWLGWLCQPHLAPPTTADSSGRRNTRQVRELLWDGGDRGRCRRSRSGSSMRG